jgi:hypothetical protein
LKAANSSFGPILQDALQNDIESSRVTLSQGPNINFVLSGENGNDVTLTVASKTYWQFDAPSAGRAFLATDSSNMPQSILGPPLRNNYFTVFDRSDDPYGVIRFAPIKA